MIMTGKNTPQAGQDLRRIVNEYFGLLGEGKFREGLRFFAPDCKTHNPYVRGDMNTLTDAMIAASKNMSAQMSQPELTVKHVLVDGDLVAVHTQLLNSKSSAGEGGLRQVHVFRFQGDKIVEYWDITQQIMSSMPNAGGAF
jgi:predicted SnoaL-like aldol condensation-catalyzing enzyme